jgi:pimeloyl-ACP methyl ester carboxylesterase
LENIMPIRERWVTNGNIRLHCLESVAGSTLQTPLLIVPGVFGTADDYVDEMEGLAPRKCIAVTLRGRGRSDAPGDGYTLEDHVSDIAATVTQSGFQHPAIMGYAIGAAYAIAYATELPGSVAGLIIGDYPARYRALSEKWVSRALETMGERARPEVACALQRDSAQIPLWERLASLRCPVAIVRGGQANSMVTEEIAARYRESLPSAAILTIEANGHELWKPDFDTYIRVIRDFLSRVDGKSRTS